MPIYEGYSIPNTVERADIGGSDITNYLRLLLKRSGYNFNSPVSFSYQESELEILKNAKETIVACKPSTIQEEDPKTKDQEQVKSYALPDGSLMNIGSERTKAAEIMFKPSVIGFENPGVHQLILNSIKRSDMDLRDSLYKNVVLSGGNTMIQGFHERLGKELQNLIAKTNTTVNSVLHQVKVFNSVDRQLSSWKGASILSSMAAMKGVWISSKIYKDEGDRALVKFSF